MDSSVQVTTHDEVTVVTVIGRIDLDVAEPLSDELARVAAEDHRDALVDLTRVRSMDSTGLAVLLTALTALRRAGRRMELVLDQRRARRERRLSALADAFVVHHSVEGALLTRA